MKAAWPRHGVYKVLPAGPWFVPSASNAHVFWQVEQLHLPKLGFFWTCGCPAGVDSFMTGGPERDDQRGLLPACRHVRAVGWAEVEDGLAPRPPGELGDPARFVE